MVFHFAKKIFVLIRRKMSYTIRKKTFETINNAETAVNNV